MIKKSVLAMKGGAILFVTSVVLGFGTILIRLDSVASTEQMDVLSDLAAVTTLIALSGLCLLTIGKVANLWETHGPRGPILSDVGGRRMNKLAKASVVIMGIVSVICATLGLFYNASVVADSFADVFQKGAEVHELTNFYPTLYAMSAMCIICYAVLLFCGIEFLRLRLRFVSLFVCLLVFEVIYFFSVDTFLAMLGLGDSVAAAFGVANGALSCQLLILFPLWGPILALWAKHRIEAPTKHS